MRILVATDGSDASDRAIDLAAKLARELEGRLKIVHVVTGRDVPEDELSDYALREHCTPADVLNAFAEEKLRVAKQRAEALGAANVESESRSESELGDIAGSIIEVARQDEADMIVVGKRGLSRFSGLILGSVSQKITTVAPCAVVVVP